MRPYGFAAVGHRLRGQLDRVRFPGSTSYWEIRYARGGSSGAGSSGRLAEFKAEILNGLVQEHAIRSVIEFGCGDGRQLMLATYPNYIGLDVSKTAIRTCQSHFRQDSTKSFYLYDPGTFVDNAHLFQADAAISVDVIFHLVEDEVFAQHMRHLFGSAKRFVVIYSSNSAQPSRTRHERPRIFTDWIDRNLSDWHLLSTVPNRYPSWDDALGSASEFYIYAHN